MAYIGNQAQTAFTSFDKQTITGDGTAVYTLSHSVANDQEVEVFVNNVRQEGGSGKAYTVSGNQITFSENIASTDTVYLNFAGKAVQTVVPPAGSVTDSMITGMSSSKLTGALPALDGSALTGVSGGKLLQFVSDQSAIGSSTATIPQDNTPPTITEGVEVFSCAITPTAANSTLLIQMGCQVSGSANGRYVVWDLFEGNTFVHAWSNYLTASNGGSIITFNVVRAASSTSARTYSVRAGFASGTPGTLYYGYVSGNSYGQLNKNYMTIQEIAG